MFAQKKWQIAGSGRARARFATAHKRTKRTERETRCCASCMRPTSHQQYGLLRTIQKRSPLLLCIASYWQQTREISDFGLHFYCIGLYASRAPMRSIAKNSDCESHTRRLTAPVVCLPFPLWVFGALVNLFYVNKLEMKIERTSTPGEQRPYTDMAGSQAHEHTRKTRCIEACDDKN